MVIAPSASDLESSKSWARSISEISPSPSQRRHIPSGLLKPNRNDGPTWGSPRRLNKMRRRALASVAVPTVERELAPIGSWSTMIAALSPLRPSTSGRPRLGMKDWTKAVYVSLISRCDSAAMVPNTSELLPEPETPVKTVRRRLGMSTEMSLRLFTRAPWTRMRSWVSAGWRASAGSWGCGACMFLTSLAKALGFSARTSCGWEVQSSAHRLLHERGDPCLVGCGQLRQPEGDRPQRAFVEVRLVAEAQRCVPRLELLRGLEVADDLAVLGIRGHPVPEFRREGWRAGFDDSMQPLAQGAIRCRHLGDLGEHGAFPVRRVRGRLHLLDARLPRASFLVFVLFLSAILFAALLRAALDRGTRRFGSEPRLLL